jgi:hypothetical protein
MSIETRRSRLVEKTGVEKSRWTVPLIYIYSLQLYSLHIIFACLYSLLLVIRFEANQSESDPFIRFEANKYSL